jgi:hypothetical protein
MAHSFVLSARERNRFRRIVLPQSRREFCERK